MSFLLYMATLLRMSLMRPKRRAHFALSILDKRHKGERVGAYSNAMDLFRDIEKTKKPGIIPALKFVESRAGQPPYIGPCDLNDKHRPGLELRVLLWSLKFYLVSETEQEIKELLQSIIQKSLPHAKGNDDASSLIRVACEHLHRAFNYPKPTGDGSFELPGNTQAFLR